MISMSGQDAQSLRAQLDQVLIGGPEKRPIVVVTYDRAAENRQPGSAAESLGAGQLSGEGHRGGPRIFAYEC